MNQKLRIGFPRLGHNGGPQIFLRRLHGSFIRQGLAWPRSCFLPFYDIGLFNSVARNFYGKPYILRVDGIYYSKTLTHPSYQELNEPIRKSLLNAKGVIYQSRFSKVLIEKYFGRIDSTFAIIGNGTDIHPAMEDKETLRRELGLPIGEKLLITAAAWRRHKRLREMIDVTRRLHQIDDRFALVVMGDAQTQFKESFVYSFGNIPPQAIHKYYQAADLYLHLCWLDNCPNTVVEAIANGIPVVCSNQGGTHEIIEGAHAGIVSACDENVDPTDVDLNNPPEPDLSCVMKDILQIFEKYDEYQGRIIRHQVDIDVTVRQYLDFIMEVLHR